MGAWKNFFRSWHQTPGIHASTLAVLIGTFSVICIAVNIGFNLKNILSSWGQSVQLTVYLQDELKEEEISKVKSALQDLEQFDKVEFISKQAAAQRLQKSMGSYSPKLFNDPEFTNPLPISFEATLKQGVQSAVRYNQLVSLAETIQKYAGVEEVSYGQGWVENYAGFLKSVDYTLYGVIALLFFGSILVIGNSIRSSIYQRRDEIEILELCGATSYYIRWPYIFEGALMGAIASLAAIAITYGVFFWQKEIFGQSLLLWGVQAQIQFLNLPLTIALFMLGAALGTIGSYICVRQLATGWSAAERNES